MPARFTLEIVGKRAPARNKALEGLYVSGGNFCTQCEAEGFRRITWFLDRPDVMARYRTRIDADKHALPGAALQRQPGRERRPRRTARHFAVWEDPSPSLVTCSRWWRAIWLARSDSFVTRSGREVAAARCYVAEEHLDQTEHCMESLKRAMKWDEEAFGREYDLDIYMIVAVRDFNMGAMENKGLNVFNTKYVLARPDTATDADFSNVEAVVAHEYFHNWSGNRVTCRDWFQLSLKEGFTVFRDQEFSSRRGLARAQAHSGRAAPVGRAVSRGRRAHGPSGAARLLRGDQQLLHADGLRKGRRGGAHDADAARAPRRFRARHGPVLRAPRRPGRDLRRLRATPWKTPAAWT